MSFLCAMSLIRVRGTVAVNWSANEGKLALIDLQMKEFS